MASYSGNGGLMRILVTGAAGFIGSHVCEQLLADGHDVVGIDAFVPYYPRVLKERNLAALATASRFNFHELDLRHDRLADCLQGVDGVIHEAAMPGLVRSWTDFDEYVSCNLLATQRLLEACRSANVRKFVHISTSSVYGAEAVGDELQETRPVSPYGVTKLAAEHLVLSYVREFDFPALILRYFSIYGPRQRPDMAYSVFITRMLEGRSITVYGDGSQSRSNTYVMDCTRGTILALEAGQIGEIYNIGGGQVITLNDAIAIIADALGVRPIVAYGPRRPGDQWHTRADISKARDAFDYKPSVLPIDGLRMQAAWQASQRAAPLGAGPV
jgi:nucleoside-diphosphate-sugar epimerase